MATITQRTWKTSKGEDRKAWVLAYTDKKGKRHKEQFEKQKLADLRRIEVEGQINAGTHRESAKRKTVSDAIDAYSKALDRRLDEGSATRMYVSNTKAQLDTHIRPAIGKLKLSEVTAKTFADQFDELKDAGIGIPMIRRVVGAASRCMEYARQQDMVATNPVKGIRITSKRGTGNTKVTPPTKEEFAAILKAAEEFPPVWSKQPPALALRIRFAARTGLRASEQWALRWHSIDLENALVIVSARVDAFGQIDTTKTEAGQRSVKIGKALVADLKAWREQTRYAGNDDFVFPDARGGFTRHTNFTKRFWNPVLTTAGLKTGWHSLRHFAVSTWIEAGLPPKAVQTLAGHASYHITMSRYGHLFPSEDHAAIMDKIEL